ncbi:MAG: DUF4296 domain-containing protein [Saprospiraceae bacterium]|nr:DUF4296 domain-containing protein [Saprospiraceae bacterium]
MKMEDSRRWVLNASYWKSAILFAFFAAFITIVSCQFKPPVQPSLSDEKIARIMSDFSIAEAATNGLAGYTKDSLMQVYYKQVFEMHGITLEAYEQDLRILAQDLPRMDAIVKMADELLTEGSKGKAGPPNN